MIYQSTIQYNTMIKCNVNWYDMIQCDMMIPGSVDRESSWPPATSLLNAPAVTAAGRLKKTIRAVAIIDPYTCQKVCCKEINENWKQKSK